MTGAGRPGEQRPEILDKVAEWVERREPDRILTSADDTVDQVFRTVPPRTWPAQARGCAASETPRAATTAEAASTQVDGPHLMQVSL